MPTERDPRPYLRARGVSEDDITKATAQLDQTRAWIKQVAPLALRAHDAARREDWATTAHMEQHILERQEELTHEQATDVIDMLLAQLAEMTWTMHDHAPETFERALRGDL